MEYVFIVLILGLALLLGAAWINSRNRSEVVARREPDAAELRRVEELAAADKVVEAVKAYREATGAGLVEAKQAVDRMRQG
ncbi:hypothetical protein WIS52_21970 [Pseudonocardia nematodicida]|uniref:Ribosomal protein L7/L12 C-terminal domain-containing protein n=1 Tax=Pseudonocardia nematodicida TaxID=1206997 RepID=A0ABV1KF93_9PSEU